MRRDEKEGTEEHRGGRKEEEREEEERERGGSKIPCRWESQRKCS